MRKSEAYLSREEWKARYAELSGLYEGGNPQHPKPINREKVRQWEELTYRLNSPAGYYTPNIRIPSDPDFAFRGIFCFVAGLPERK